MDWKFDLGAMVTTHAGIADAESMCMAGTFALPQACQIIARYSDECSAGVQFRYGISFRYGGEVHKVHENELIRYHEWVEGGGIKKLAELAKPEAT